MLFSIITTIFVHTTMSDPKSIILISIKEDGAFTIYVLFKTRKEEVYYFSTRLLIENCKVLLALEFHSKTIRRCVRDQV